MSKRRGSAWLLRCAVALLACSIVPPISAARAQVPQDLLGNLHWRSIGPFRGGRALAVQGAPDDPRRFYFGAVNGGVWRTDDAGRTWQPIFDSAPVGSIGALAVAPSAPRTLYAGTGEADMRSDIAQGVGLFRSTDGGLSWTQAGLRDTQQIGRILVDPRNPDVVLVAALGHPYGPNPMRGVFRSEDGGRTWSKTLFRDDDTGAIDLAFQPDNPDIVYASLWQTRRPPWSVYPPSSGPGSGLYKSIDGGRTWLHLTGHGLPQAPGRIGLATTPARPRRVYALVDVRHGDQGGLYRSDDAGADWVRVSDDPRITKRGWYFSGITADPKHADTVYVCDTIMLRSDDGGAHFVPVKGDPTGDDFHTLWIDPANPSRRMLGVDQGAVVTLNGGRTWSSWYNQPTGQFYHVITDNRFPYRVYGAQQDSGAVGIPSRSDTPADGINMTEFHETAAGGESDNIAPDPDDPDVVYGGRVDRLDLRSGQMRDVDPTLAFPDSDRRTWTLPLVFGPLDHALYFANQRIFRSGDGGLHWRPISPDLTRPDPAIPATLDQPTIDDVTDLGKRRGVVYAIAPSPLVRDTIWAGTDDGLVWITRDGGAHWSDVTPKGLRPWSKIGVVEPSPFDRQTAYLAVDRHRLDDVAPYIYRTRDGGQSWTAITDGIAEGGVLNSVNVVRADPRQRGLLFAGTERGAYVSFDDGSRWQPLQTGLPRTSVRDMTIHGGDLVIATHGRGFYILDDIASLRALAADPSPGPRLFAPASAIRVHPPRFNGTPMPKDEPMAPNPPEGAIIDYALPAEARTPVVIDIIGPHGDLVRHFSSAGPAPKLDLATLPVAPQWAPVPVRPDASPGAHRLVWDLRYPKPAILDGGDPEPQPIWAPPGLYSVVLNVDGKAMRQPLRVLPDPRLTLDPGDLDAEFVLAQKIQAARVECRTIQRDAAALSRTTRSPATRQALKVLLDPPSTGRNATPTSPDDLAGISQRLDKLAMAVDGADAAPSPDARQGFSQTSQALADARARWLALASPSSTVR